MAIQLARKIDAGVLFIITSASESQFRRNEFKVPETAVFYTRTVRCQAIYIRLRMDKASRSYWNHQQMKVVWTWLNLSHLPTVS